MYIFCINCFVAAIRKILAQKHCLQNAVLAVEPYYKWLGSAVASVSPSHIPHESQLIDTVTVQCDPKVIEYIMHTPALKTEIETRLESDRCLVCWPKSHDDRLELKYQRTSEQHYPAQDWANKCGSMMDQFLSDFRSETVNVLQEIWNKFQTQLKQRLKNVNFVVKYDFDNDHCNLNFIGKKDASEKFMKIVESIKAGLEEELRKKHEQITESITSLSSHQLMILSLCNYADEAAAEKDAKIVITHDEVHMTGMPDEVKCMKLKLFQKINNLKNDMLPVSKALAELMGKDSVKSYLLECFRRQQVVSSWNVRDSELYVYAFNDDQLAKAKEIIQTAFVEKEFALDASSKALMSQPKWKEFETQLTAEHEMVYMYKGKEGVLVLCCVNECSGDVQEKVQDFIEKNSLVQKLQSLMQPVADFLEQFMSSDLERIRSKLAQCGGDIKRADDESEPGFLLLGTQSSVDWASSELVKLTETLAMFDHEIDRPGVPEYLMSTPGRAIMSELQRRHQVVIDLESSCTSMTAAAGRRDKTTTAVVKYSRKVILTIYLNNSF